MITITYESLTDFQVLYKVYEECRKKKRSTYAQIRFERNMSWELIKLQNSLIEYTYIMSKGRRFLITEPKEHWITVSPFIDKIIQKLLCTTVFQPYLETHSIYNSGACQKGKGVSFAVSRLTKHLRYETRQYLSILHEKLHKRRKKVN